MRAVAFDMDRRRTNLQVFAATADTDPLQREARRGGPLEGTSGLPNFHPRCSSSSLRVLQKIASERSWREHKAASCDIGRVLPCCETNKHSDVRLLLTLMSAFQSQAQSDLSRRFPYGRCGGVGRHLCNYRNRQIAMVGRFGRLQHASAGPPRIQAQFPLDRLLGSTAKINE